MAYERPRSRAVWRRRRWTMKHSRRQTRPTYDQSAAPCRRTVVATARPSISVWQTPWRANTLAVGRFGEQLADASESLIRQTRPTYGQSAVPCRRTVVAKPARLSAYGKHHGVRTPPESGGLAESVLEHRKASSAKHGRPTSKAPRLAVGRSWRSPPVYQRMANTTAHEHPRSRAVWQRAQ